jgi:PAS domain S-box-containing protein
MSRSGKISFKDLHIPGDDVNFLKKFFALRPEDEEQLPALRDLAKACVSKLSEHVQAEPETSRMFANRMVLERYVDELSSSKCDSSYVNNRLHSATVTNISNLSPKWYLGSFSYYLDTIASALDEEPLEAEEKFLRFRSLVKKVMFDIALTMESTLIQRENELQRQQTAIRDAEEFMRSLLDAAVNIAIYGISADGSLQSWNKGAENLLGHRASDIIGQNFRKLFPNEETERGEIEAHFREASAGLIETATWRMRRDGSKFLAKVVTASIRDANGEVSGYVEIIQDETERFMTQESLASQRQQISELIKVLSVVTKNISSIASELATSTAQSGDSIAETTAISGAVMRIAEETNKEAKGISSNAKGVVEVSKEGQTATEQTTQGMVRITEQMKSISDSMTIMKKQSRLIGDIINTVDDLAQQSNLLALNASIEAAKAGEHGKGFGVVADEVKSLSQQSKEATSSVRRILTEIMKATIVTSQVIDQGTAAVNVGHEQAANAGNVIKTLSKSIEQASVATQLIEASSQQQLLGLQQVVQAMENVKLASSKNSENANRLEESGKELNDLGRRLLVLTTVE